MKSKLKRRVLILASAATLLAVGAGSFYAYRKAQVRLQYARWKAEGLADAAHGKNDQALDLLTRYLQRYPDDVAALAEFAHVRPLVVLPRNGQIAPTIYVLRHLLKLEPSRIAEKRQLLDLYVRTHYWTEADGLAGELLPSSGVYTPADLPALAARTQARLAQRNWSDALVWAIKWSKLDPADLQPQIILLNLVHQTQNFGAVASLAKTANANEAQVADALAGACEKAIAAKGGSVANDPRPAIIRGHGLLLAAKGDQALKFFDVAASKKLSDRYAGELLVNEFDSLGRSAQAMPVLKRVARETADPSVQDLLARRSWESGDWASVADLLSKLDPSDANSDSELLALRASALTRLGRQAEADAIRAALSKRQGDVVAAAWALVLNGDASKPLDPARIITLCTPAENASWYLGFFLGDAQARLGQTELAIRTLQNAAARNITWSVPMVRASQLLLESGHYDAALQAGRDAYRRQNSLAAMLAMARAWDLCIQNGSAGQADQLLGALAELQSKVKDDGQIVCIRADVLGATGKPRQAAAAIRAELAANGKSFAQQWLLQLAAISRKYKLGTEQLCLAQSRSDHGVTPELAYATAIAQYAAGHPADGLKVLEADRAQASKPDIEWNAVHARYLDLMRDPRAAKELTHLADQNPKDLSIQLQALDARSVRTDREFMDRTINRVRSLTGDPGVAWQLARARWLLAFDSSKTAAADAAKLLANVMRLSPDQIEAHALMAACDERSGQLADAITQMRLATLQSPRSASLGLNLARLLELHGEFDAARDELTRVRSLAFADSQQRQGAAVLAAQAGDPALALALAQDAIADQSTATDNGQQLLLAQLYWHSGKPTEALAICQKLLEKPELPAIQFTADIYASQGRMDDATRVLGKLDSLKLEPGTRELALADFALRYLGPDAALRHLQQAAITGKNNPQVWRAMIAYQLAAGHPADAAAALTQGLRHAPSDSLLKKLHSRASALAAADAEPALRPMAVAFARNPDDLQASEVLDAVLARRSADEPPDQLESRIKAIADQHPRFLPVWIYLVQCCLHAGHADDALATALRAAREFPAAPEPQAICVQLLRNQGRWSEVLTEARKLRGRTISNPLPADLQIAEADLQLKRPADALTQLEPYVQNARSAPKIYDAVLPLYAQARKMAGNTGTAALMEPMLKQGARGRQQWIIFAINTLDPAEAAAWLDRVEKLIPSDAAAEKVFLAQAWGILGQRSHDPADHARALALLKPLADRSNSDEPTVLAFAMENEAAGHPADAVPYYRRAIAMAPDDIVAKNNLAMILARSGGDLNQASSLAQAAIKLRPDVPSLYDTLAFVEAKMGRLADAAQSARTAIKMQPKDPQYRATLTQVLLDSGKPADARQALRDLDSLHLDPASQPDTLRRQIETLRSALHDPKAQAAAR